MERIRDKVQRCLILEHLEDKEECLRRVYDKYCNFRRLNLKDAVLRSEHPSRFAELVDAVSWCSTVSATLAALKMFPVRDIRFFEDPAEELYLSSPEDALKLDKLYAFAMAVGCRDYGSSTVVEQNGTRVVFQGHTNAVAKAICGVPLKGIRVEVSGEHRSPNRRFYVKLGDFLHRRNPYSHTSA